MKIKISTLILTVSFAVTATLHAHGGQKLQKYLDSVTQWPGWGQNVNNNHHNINSKISKGQAKKLERLCKIDFRKNSGDALNVATGKVTIIEDTVYWAAGTGQIGAHKINRDRKGRFVSCDKIWQHSVSDIVNLGLVGLTSRTSPAYYERAGGKGTLLYMTPSNYFEFAFTNPTNPTAPVTTRPTAFAIDAETGNKLWEVSVALSGAEDPSALFPSTTSSPRIYNGFAYIGLASLNNVSFGGPPGLQTARGHMIRLDLKVDGGIPSFPADVKTLYSLPEKPDDFEGQWFAGGGIWASTPSIIPNGGKEGKGLVLYATGQLYAYPDFVGDCMSEELEEPIIIEGQSFSERGETGGGAQQCYEQAVETLENMGVDTKKTPLASNSVIAVNLADFSVAWSTPTNGIDAWLAACGGALELENSPECQSVVPTAGPDWDVGGNSPVVARYSTKKGFKTAVITHNKGGELLWLDAGNGEIFRRADVCVGSAVGGIHWGFGYDPIRKTLLVPCAGSDPYLTPNYTSTLANGTKVCQTGYLNAIDVKNGSLIWQAVPADPTLADNNPICPAGNDVVDARFKSGKNFDIVLKNRVDNSVPVRVMPSDDRIPAPNMFARADGVPASSRGVVYWSAAQGVTYALNINNGKLLNQMFCDVGGTYTSTASVANGYVIFGCGRAALLSPDPNASALGDGYVVHGLIKDRK